LKDILKDYAFAFGVLSASAEFVHWTPQIWKTWKAKDPGSLSIAMLVLQAPGSFLVVVSLSYDSMYFLLTFVCIPADVWRERFHVAKLFG
jgi:hypothetical protein